MTKLHQFKELGLSDTTLQALAKKGFEEPTDIQAKCIPLMLASNINVVGQAQTGTGKTAAFGLPIIEKVSTDHNVQALILTPTRELAIQVSEELNSLKGSHSLQITAIYGGQSIDQQIRRLKKGVQIVVGTPGRVIDHLNRKTLKLNNLQFMILDEADEMLNMGFIDDIENILKHTPDEKNMLLFSATMPKRILSLTQDYMPDYVHIEVKKEQLTTNLTDQIYFEVRESDKFDAMCRIIDIEEDFYGVVFCRTKVDVDKLTAKLTDRGYDVEGLHGDLSQKQREFIFGKFKSGKVNILMATDVAARGLDVENLTHVINYALPQDPESYVHRIGRTGRAGKEGTAITFITPAEYRKLMFISKKTKSDIRREKLPKASDIIRTKKKRIKTDIQDILLEEDLTPFHKLATELLHDRDARGTVAALLRYTFYDELDETQYRDISRQASPDKTGTARLFVAKGKKDGMTKKKLVDFIIKNTGVKNKYIDEVKVLDSFSFITVPFNEAEIILSVFKKANTKKPLVVKAKQK